VLPFGATPVAGEGEAPPVPNAGGWAARVEQSITKAKNDKIFFMVKLGGLHSQRLFHGFIRQKCALVENCGLQLDYRGIWFDSPVNYSTTQRYAATKVSVDKIPLTVENS
jgi:hypothetical protein